MPTIRMEKVAKIYKSKEFQSAAVLNIDLQIDQGEFVFVVGSRGAGKSTLLNIIAGETPPDRGAVYLNDRNLNRLSRRQRGLLRYFIGTVPQEMSLARRETVFANLTSFRKRDLWKSRLIEKPRVRKALALVGMPECEERYPLEFSYSECRRIELAKAIVHSPDILLLDEMTSRLDQAATWDIIRLLDEMNRMGTTVVMATTDSKTVNMMRRRVITLSDGKIAGDVRRGRYGDT